MSTFTKIKLALAAVAVVGFGIFYLGFVGQFGDEQISKGTIQSIETVTNSMTRGGQTLSSYDAFSYAIALDSLDKPVIYQEPTSGNQPPNFAKGSQVRVTWRQRGLFGKPLVYKVVQD